MWTGLCLATPPTGHSVPISCSQIMGRYNVNFRGSRWTPDLTLSGTHLNFPHPPLLSLGSGSPSFPQLSHDVTLRPPFPRPWVRSPGPKDSPTPDGSLFSLVPAVYHRMCSLPAWQMPSPHSGLQMPPTGTYQCFAAVSPAPRDGGCPLSSRKAAKVQG